MTFKNLRLALPRCEDLDRLHGHLEACGFRDGTPEPGGILRYSNPLGDDVDFDVLTLNQDDIGTYVQRGIVQIGVMSTEVLTERDVDVWRPYTFNFGSYPLILAARRGQNLASLGLKPTLRLATPIQRYVREWFTQRGFDIEVIPVAENLAEAVMLGLADGFVDRLIDPDDLVNRGFHALERVGTTHLKLIVNNATSSKRRKTISRLIKCLEATKPEPPNPIAIPFDSEDVHD